MKIAVLGNIIDTNNIYKISPIKLPSKTDWLIDCYIITCPEIYLPEKLLTITL